MTIKKLKVQLLALKPIDKAEAIGILTQSLKNSILAPPENIK